MLKEYIEKRKKEKFIEKLISTDNIVTLVRVGSNKIAYKKMLEDTIGSEIQNQEGIKTCFIHLFNGTKEYIHEVNSQEDITEEDIKRTIKFCYENLKNSKFAIRICVMKNLLQENHKTISFIIVK